MILAAGFGTRLRPLTRLVPKPLIPVWQVPVLEHHLRLLKRHTINNVIINLHYNANSIVRYLARREPDELKITLSFEPDILGTGGALKKARWFFGEKDFWMLNADVAADMNPAHLLHTHQNKEPLATCWMIPDRGPKTVEVENGIVSTFRSSRPGTENTFTFSGVQLISSRIWSFFPDRPFCSIIEAYEAGMSCGERIAGVCCPGSFWADIGTPGQLLDAHSRIYEAHRDQNAGYRLYTQPSTAALNKKTSGEIESGRSIVFAGSRIHRNAELNQAIVGPNVYVRRTAEGIVLPATETLDVSVQSWLNQNAVPVHQCAAQFLKERGSERSFIRLESVKGSWMLIIYSRKRTENQKLVPHTAWLKAVGLSVPDVYAHDARNGWILMEDVGMQSLQEAVRSASGSVRKKLYTKVISETALLHTRGLEVGKTMQTASLMPPFNRKLFAMEHQLFTEWYLEKLSGFTTRKRRCFEPALKQILHTLSGQTAVLLHRDLQSSNILLKQGQPVFIDYQGMRKGPAAYDLASLLADPYVMLDEPFQNQCIAYYESSTGTGIQDLFWWAVMQRMIQAIGAYARISLSTQNRSFLNYIPGAQQMIRRALLHIQLDEFPDEFLHDCAFNTTGPSG